MRTANFFTLAIAAGLLVLPGSIKGQESEIPCVDYATFERNGSNTQIIGLALGDVPAGATVTLSCSGTSCPFSSKSFTMKSNVSTLALTDMFADPNLKPGTVLEIRVTKPGWTGKAFQYEIRTSDDPRSTTSCLPSDGSKPVVCVKKVGRSG